MKKIEQLVNREGVHLKRHKPSRILSDYYIKTAAETKNFTISIRTDLDFFNAMIMIESLKNKALFESTYERERKELADLWPTLIYQERNKLINLKIAEAKKRSRSFVSEQGETIWIAFFDQLMNALYDREMNIFDLPQYFILYKEYKKRMVPLSTYGLSAFSASFLDIKVLQQTQNRVIFIYEPLKALYRVTLKEGSLDQRKLCLDPEYRFDPDHQDALVQVMDALDRDDKAAVIDLLCASSWLSAKVIKRLTKLKRKLK